MTDEKGRKAYRLGSILKKDEHGKPYDHEKLWDIGEVLDQGDEPSSVGYAWTAWQNCKSKNT